MEPFEYVVVLSSLILGLGISQILTGVADVVSNWNNVKVSTPHAIYTIVVFLLHLQEWWASFVYSNAVTSWTPPVVLGILLFPLLLFFQARMLFPTGLRSSEANLEMYFEDQFRGIYLVGFFGVVVSIWHNYIFENLTLPDQLHLIAYMLVYLIFIFGNIKNYWAHLVFTSLQLIALLYWFLFYPTVLE